jgi:hypothetical protein
LFSRNYNSYIYITVKIMGWGDLSEIRSSFYPTYFDLDQTKYILDITGLDDIEYAINLINLTSLVN